MNTNAKVATQEIKLTTKGHTDIVDITDDITQSLSRAGLKEGIATIFVVGSTASITTVEYEPGLVQDLKSAFEKLAPSSGDYKHHERWHDDNGHSHVRASLMGPSITVPFTGGKLILGTWQQIVLIDFDTTSRDRTIIVQIIGQ